MDSEGPLLDRRQNTWILKEQTGSHYSSFPIRSTVSTHDILSENCSSAKQQQVSRTSLAGVWRTPFSQHSVPTPSTQPIRIDIPVTRGGYRQLNPPLTTFQQSSSLLAVKKSQILKVNPQSQASNIYACPTSTAKKISQPCLSAQQQRSSTHTDQAAKPQVSITPTKHVSFQEPPSQHKKSSTGPAKQKDPVKLSDPWRREAQENREKQQRLQVVELLQQEVRELQAKGQRTAEENDRLRKLSLEWQFQKRLREIQQREDEEEEDEEWNTMVTMEQLEKRTQVSLRPY